MSKTLHGTTTITLGDESYELLPTLAAVRAIEARFGGLRGAVQAITSLSVEGCAAIIAAGAGLAGKHAEAVEEQVWQTGVVEVSVQLNKYLAALYNPRGTAPGKDKAAKE